MRLNPTRARAAPLVMYTDDVNATIRRAENERFREYVTNTAFSLQLTRGMVDVLLDLEHSPVGGARYAASGSHWRGLERRGLVRWVMLKDHPSPDPSYRGRYELTEAGAAVLPLLKLAGFQAPTAVYQAFLDAQHPPEEIRDGARPVFADSTLNPLSPEYTP